MARHGIPDNVMSDNGPQFSSQEFKNFTELYEFDYVTSSPTYAQSNVKAENAVKTALGIMLKALEAGTDPYLGFLQTSATPPLDLYRTENKTRSLSREITAAFSSVYLTIIPRARVGYEMIDSQSKL